MKNKAFTLIELLVVISIIGVLSSIVLVSFSDSRDKARLAKAQQFDAQVSHALGAYAVGIWRFEEGSGTTIHDESGYGNDGTFHGSPTPVFPAGVYAGTTALQFDGSNDYVNCGDAANEDYDAMTIEAWIKRTSNTPSGWRTPLHRNDSTNVGSSVFFIALESGSHQIVSTIGAGSSGPSYMSGATGVIAALDTWYHIVNSWDGAAARVYVNGIEKKEYALTSANFNNKLAAVTRIGASGNGTGYLFKGSIDNVAIYDEALSSAQIQQHFVAGAITHGIAVK